jgi:hypothetical protein
VPYGKSQQIISKLLLGILLINCKQSPDWLRYEIIWEKTNATGHLNAKKMPLKAHENILIFYRKLIAEFGLVIRL